MINNAIMVESDDSILKNIESFINDIMTYIKKFIGNE